MVSVSIFDVLRQHFKCSNVKYSSINHFDVLRNSKMVLFTKILKDVNVFHGSKYTTGGKT